MINDLENKTTFITGSSSGIGFGLAKRFLEANNRVIICSKNIRKIKKLKIQILKNTVITKV
jgi:short-subunit dehydrogenase involved in D-alanine esterification of teichoic acids